MTAREAQLAADLDAMLLGLQAHDGVPTLEQREAARLAVVRTRLRAAAARKG